MAERSGDINNEIETSLLQVHQFLRERQSQVRSDTESGQGIAEGMRLFFSKRVNIRITGLDAATYDKIVKQQFLLVKY